MTSEKRLKTRKKFSHPISVEFSRMGAGRLTSGRIIGVGVDLSDNGVGLTTGHALDRGEVVMLHLTVDDLNTSLPVYSEVVWTSPEKGRFRAGLRFLV